MNIVERVKQLNLPFGKYVVIGSGTLEILGLRKAKDIDIAVLPELYAQLRATGEWKEEKRYDKIFLKQNDIEINPNLNWDKYSTSTKEAIASAIIIDDVPFMNFQELRRFKQALGRKKDYADIILIDDYEKNHS